jgi:hypothetical protein
VKESYGISGRGMVVADDKAAARLLHLIERRSADAPANLVVESWVEGATDINYRSAVNRSGDVRFETVKTALLRDGVHQGHSFPVELPRQTAAELREASRCNFPVELLGRDVGQDATEPWNVTGPLCTPDDPLLKRAALPRSGPATSSGSRDRGAYGPSASPGLFLSHGFPAEVLVLDGTAHLLGQPGRTQRPDPQTAAGCRRLQKVHPGAAVSKQRGPRTWRAAIAALSCRRVRGTTAFPPVPTPAASS